MKNQILVSELLRGMNNIARMRGEIEDMLMGLRGRLVRLEEIRALDGGTGVMEFRNESVSWQLRISISPSYDHFTLYCHEVVNGKIGDEIYGSITKERQEIAMVNVQLVHGGLQVLVDGLMTRFPELVTDAQIVLQAARAFAD